MVTSIDLVPERIADLRREADQARRRTSANSRDVQRRTRGIPSIRVSVRIEVVHAR